MCIESLEGKFEPKNTIDNLLRDPELGAPMAVLTRSQARLVYQYIGGAFFDQRIGVPVAKPWFTDYRGEMLLYVPFKSGDVRIDFPPYEYTEKPIGKGIVGIARLKSISKLTENECWDSTFPTHRELGPMPYNPTFLWYLDPVRQFSQPLSIRIGGKWVDEEEFEECEFPPDPLLKDYILAPERRELHRITLSWLLNLI